MTHKEMQALASRLRHNATPVTDLEIGEAARAIYDLLLEVEVLIHRRDNDG